MRRKTKFCALALCAATLFVSGCAGAGGRGKVTLTVWAEINENNSAIMAKIVDSFNEGSERYRVRLIPQSSGYSEQLDANLKGSSPPNAVLIENDKYLKRYVEEGYLTCLDEYFTDKKDEAGNVVRAASELDLGDIWKTASDSYRYDPETGYSGEGQPLYALPTGISPGVMYYNVSALKEAGINLISVAEDELAAYNTAHGTSFLPHGYYEYSEAPAQGLSQKNGVYPVFNNRIPMNWEELVSVAKLFTKRENAASPTTYGFYNEWWFSFGWSVGGDCIEWSEQENQYVFALGDDSSNYLVTGQAGVTVNGNAYAEGDLLTYEDKQYVGAVKRGDETDAAISQALEAQTLYALPSIRDAFTLFLRLSQTTERDVTANEKGLQVSPTPQILGNKSKMNLLTSKEVAFVAENYSEAIRIGKGMEGQNLEWDIAPLYQYREYEANGTVKTVNGTPIVGKEATHANSSAYAIPSNAAAKDGAFEFVEYMASAAVQEQLMQANLCVPVLKSLAYGDTYASLTGSGFAANKAAVLEATENSRMGDWSYLENGSWVTIWSNVLNEGVRNGDITLDQFFAHPCIAETNAALKTFNAKKYVK